MSDSKVLVALDFDNKDAVLDFTHQLKPSQCRLKVGKELFTVCGPSLVTHLVDAGFDVFLDLKFHDIPNTVAKAVKAAAELGVWMVNVHASGGARMMQAARESLEQCEGQRPLLIAVTVLTSMSAEDLQEIGVTESPEEQVIKLSRLAQKSGLDGVVCSAQEAVPLKAALGKEFLLVTPGIRPADASSDDQRRIVTPQQAIKNGSDYLVIGRPITKAINPIQALADINASIA